MANLTMSRFRNTLGQSMTRLTDSVFPGAKNVIFREAISDRITTGEDTSSSITLQMMLYFNVYFSIVYGIFSVAATGYKVKWVSDLKHEAIVNPIILVVWALVEGPRLYIGMKGNAREQVAKLTSFFFLSFIPQCGVSGYFLFASAKPFPAETALNLLMFIFLLPEIVLGYLATRRAIRSQTARFFVERWATDKEEADQQGMGVAGTVGGREAIEMNRL